MNKNTEVEFSDYPTNLMPIVEQCISEKRAMKCVYGWWNYHILIPLSNGNWLATELMHQEYWNENTQELDEWYERDVDEIQEDRVKDYITTNIYHRASMMYDFCASRKMPTDKLPDREDVELIFEHDLFNLDDDDKGFWEKYHL